MDYIFIISRWVGGFFETLAKFQSYILLVVGFIIALVLLRTGIPDRLASGWEKVSGMQDKELVIGDREIKQLNDEKIQAEEKINKFNEHMLDLTREVDVRREINRQDANEIKDLKGQIAAGEEIISRLRAEIRNLNN